MRASCWYSRLVQVSVAVLCAWCFGEGVSFLCNPSHPAIGPKASQFLAALMGRSGLVKHRSSPLRSGRVAQSSSKGGDWPQVGWLSVIAMEDHLDLCCHQCHTHCQWFNQFLCVCVCVDLLESLHSLRFQSSDAAQFTFHQVPRYQPHVPLHPAPSTPVFPTLFVAERSSLWTNQRLQG